MYIYVKQSIQCHINIAGLRTPASDSEVSGVSVLTSLNHNYIQHIRLSSSFQLEYILLYRSKSSNLITESLFIIAPAIYIHNRKHISHSTSRIKTYLATPRQSRSPRDITPSQPRHSPEANQRARRDTWCLGLSCTHT